MRRYGVVTCVLALTAWTSAIHAEQFEIIENPSAVLIHMRPHAIAFAELRASEATNPTRLISFDEWANAMPAHKQLLSPYPDYTEPMVHTTVEGVTKSVQERLNMYVAQARFTVSRPPLSIDLAHYATIGFLQRLDPAIKHRMIASAETENAANKHPDRQWCQAKTNVICVHSRYQLEGKLPLAVKLVNQLTESKKYSDSLEFQSELRILASSELEQPVLMKLTGLNTPITGALDQTIFYVNQVMQFGKLLVVFQMSPDDPGESIATVFIALALKARLLEGSNKYEKVPVLRNLVPSMVLAGQSSFNTGRSISAGLPLFARNNIKAVAALLDETTEFCPGVLLQNCRQPISIPGKHATHQEIPSRGRVDVWEQLFNRGRGTPTTNFAQGLRLPKELPAPSGEDRQTTELSDP